MRTEQLTKCFEPLQKLTARFGPLSQFKPRVILYALHPFECGTSDVLCFDYFGVIFCTMVWSLWSEMLSLARTSNASGLYYKTKKYGNTMQ